MTPLLSIAIPTHNRAIYAEHAIGSILSIPDQRLELVVSDTSTDHRLEARLKSGQQKHLQDPRFRYIKPATRLDMTGNHNQAIAETTGQYVCLIGDDDTITKDALRAALWAAEHDVESISPNVVANYAWPDFRSRYFGAKHGSRLYIKRGFGDAEVGDTDSMLRASLQTGVQGTDGLPKLYHGIVKRSVLELIRRRSGYYFHGSSPDVSGAVAVALLSEQCLIVDYPLTIPGASGGSNTGRSAMNKHKGRLGEESQTLAFEDDGWARGVPKFFSVETVWAHAALETINKIVPVRILDFNFARLIGICRSLHGEFKTEIDTACAEAAEILDVRQKSFEHKVREEMWRYRSKKAITLSMRLMKLTAAGGRDYVPGLSSIEDCPGALRRYLESCNISWLEFERIMTAKWLKAK